MYDYSIVPSEKIKQRMDFYYTPYNTQFLLRKHMTFEETPVLDDGMRLLNDRRRGMASCLDDTLDPLQIRKAETAKD